MQESIFGLCSEAEKPCRGERHGRRNQSLRVRQAQKLFAWIPRS